MIGIEFPLLHDCRPEVVGDIGMAYDKGANAQIECCRFLRFLLGEGVDDELEVGGAVRGLFVEGGFCTEELCRTDVHLSRQ